ncbi:MAG: methyltransferase domain-containing protein [Blastocatellia bacterium]|nr:methyltransferase domain-containing protein [Blastocatellia bacterium]
MSNSEIVNERRRILDEYNRREVTLDKSLYAPWEPGELFMTLDRKKETALQLHKLNSFPRTGNRCLEIGYGKLGWLADLISWGVKETDLFGIELDANRAAVAQAALPKANLITGDATELPWENNYFQYVVLSTVFSSILDESVRNLIAKEIIRVLDSGGVLIYYDIAVNNPNNKNIKAVSRKELETMFPDCELKFKSITLAPPISRIIAGRSWVLATFLNALPFLRTHQLAFIIKN